MGEARPSLPSLVSQLLDDGVSVVRAEVAFAKARVVTKIVAARSGAILLVSAAVVALLALIGLVIGVLMALATVVGFLPATAIVFLVLAVVAAVLGWLGARKLSGKPQPISETDL